MIDESQRRQGAHTSTATAVETGAPLPTKAVLGGMAAVLVVAAVWAGSMRPTPLQDGVREQRLARIAAMSPAEREQLRQNFEAFEELSRTAQEALRDLDRAVAAQQDSDELVAVMTRYDAWLDELSYEDRYKLTEMEVDVRLEEIAQRRVQDYHLPREDVRLIAVWLKQRIEMRSGDGRNVRETGRLPLDRQLRTLNEAIGRFERSVSEGLSVDKKLDEMVGQLISQLSEATRNQLKMAGVAAQQRNALARWLRRIETRRQLYQEIVREVTSEQVEAYIGSLSEEDQRRWRREYEENPDRVIHRIMSFKRPSQQRGPRPGRGLRPDMGPGGPAGRRPPRRGDGADALKPRGRPPEHSGEG